MGRMTDELEWGKRFQYPVNRMLQGFWCGETEYTFSFGDLNPVNHSVTELHKYGYFWGLGIYLLDSTKLNMQDTARPISGCIFLPLHLLCRWRMHWMPKHWNNFITWNCESWNYAFLSFVHFVPIHERSWWISVVFMTYFMYIQNTAMFMDKILYWHHWQSDTCQAASSWHILFLLLK